MTGAAQLADAPHRQAVQRRTIGTLVAMQASGNAAIASVIAVATLLAADLLGSDTLAGLAAAMLTCGAALVAVPLAQHMRRRGRRPGLVVAYAVAAGGATLAAAAGEARLFPLFVIGMFLIGVGQAANLAGRYVAADLALPERRARAISIVVWTGTLGAVFGPTFATLEKDAAASAGLNRLVGPLLFGVAYFLVAGAVVWTCMRPDPLVVAGGLAAADEPRVRRVTQARAAFAVIRQSAGARLGLVAMVVSQTCMVAVMTMTPLHMKDHGQADLSALVIAVHILGMYGLAPLVGVTADRVGRIRVIQVGAAILGAGTLISVLAGYHAVLIFVGLFLLGLGWSCGLIGGSTLLTESVPVRERVSVQGAADLVMGVCGALGALGSGLIKAQLGFHILADAATIAAIVLLVAATTSGRRPAMSTAG
ncbi:MAG TPA: MFS transporter [Acidimicrobiales bacterium]|nr:MFS transporter [Acidimicrobiales bacterium]